MNAIKSHHGQDVFKCQSNYIVKAVKIIDIVNCQGLIVISFYFETDKFKQIELLELRIMTVCSLSSHSKVTKNK
jgi:hypothetical protein